MSQRWSTWLAVARRGALRHAQGQQLLDDLATRGRWDRIERWLLTVLRQAIAPGERDGSCIATAAWLQRQRRSALAQRCLETVNWPQADAHAWLLRGQVAQTLGQRAIAQRHLIRALVLPGGQAVAAYRLGQLQRSAGDFDQAASWFLASLQVDPAPHHIHNELQFTRCSDALLPELVDFYEQLCQRQPERALTGQLLAHYLIKQGNQQRAIAESRRAARLELGPLEAHLAPADAEPTPPDFLIAGVPKGGTTAMLRWLDHQPGLWCHPRKELHFFDGRYAYGSAWYCAQFPRFEEGAAILRGEATPNYFSHAETPERIAALMPTARIIVMLRDPVARAISWVQHLQRLEGLQGSVEHWLAQELEQLQPLSAEQLALSPRVGTGALQDSCYDLHLCRWRQHLPQAQMLLLSSDRLFQAPAPELSRILQFLGQPADPTPWIEHWRPLNVNPAAAARLSPPLKARLQQFFQQHCGQALTDLTENSPRPHQPDARSA